LSTESRAWTAGPHTPADTEDCWLSMGWEGLTRFDWSTVCYTGSERGQGTAKARRT
jgi:hypothetical protein